MTEEFFESGCELCDGRAIEWIGLNILRVTSVEILMNMRNRHIDMHCISIDSLERMDY